MGCLRVVVELGEAPCVVPRQAEISRGAVKGGEQVEVASGEGEVGEGEAGLSGVDGLAVLRREGL